MARKFRPVTIAPYKKQNHFKGVVTFLGLILLLWVGSFILGVL